MTTRIESAIKSAQAKFGEVYAAMPHRGGFCLAIRRNDPASPERPFMTINAFRQPLQPSWDFTTGHYDLTFDNVFDNLKERIAG